MSELGSIHELNADQLEEVSGGNPQLGVYRSGFRFKEESLAFFRKCVGDETFARAMSSEAGRRHHYVVARAFLNQADWERFVWIEQFGSLDGFPGV